MERARRNGGRTDYEGVERNQVVGARGPAPDRRGQGHRRDQRPELGRLGRRRRRRHLLRRQRRLLRRGRQARPPDLSRPHAKGTPRGARRLRDPGRHHAGPDRPRCLGRRRAAPHERAVGDGRRRAHPPRRPRSHARNHSRRDLRCRHALPARRGVRAVRGPLLPDHLVGARVPCALEARLPSLLRVDGRRRLRGSVARRGPQRPLQQRGSRRARARLSAGPRIAQADERVRSRRRAHRDGGRGLVPARLGGLARQPRARPRRLPVRHPPAGDRREPHLRAVEAQAADDEGRGRKPEPLQPDRILLVRGAQRLHPRTCRARAAAGGLHRRAHWRPRSEIHAGAARAQLLADRGRPVARCRRGWTRASPRC